MFQQQACRKSHFPFPVMSQPQGDALGTFRLTSEGNTSQFQGSGPFFTPVAFKASGLTILSRISHILASKHPVKWNQTHLRLWQQPTNGSFIYSSTILVYETIISFLPILLTITWAYLLCLKSRHHLHMSAQVVSAIAALQ